MPGLYNVIFGNADPSTAAFLLLLAGFNGEVPVRFRDVWVEGEGDVLLIRVHTRIGGGNRDDYTEEWDRYRAMPAFVRDEDDDFDSTYADLYFRADVDGLLAKLAAVGSETPADEARSKIEAAVVALAQPPVDMGARWQAAIDAIGRS